MFFLSTLSLIANCIYAVKTTSLPELGSVANFETAVPKMRKRRAHVERVRDVVLRKMNNAATKCCNLNSHMTHHDTHWDTSKVSFSNGLDHDKKKFENPEEVADQVHHNEVIDVLEVIKNRHFDI